RGRLHRGRPGLPRRQRLPGPQARGGHAVIRRWLVPALFGALCLAQIAVPVSMITRYEATLRRGTVFKGRTAPVAPVDAFRGRYVWFRLDLAPGEQDGSIPGGAGWASP